MDNLTPEQRTRAMRSVTSTDTGPELAVRKSLHRLGFRYRLNVRSLPGTPDIVLPRFKKIILVHGCFWHRHSCKAGRSFPSTRQDYWSAKFERNNQRDLRIRRLLRLAGWKVMVIWECQIRPSELSRLESRLCSFLDSTE